MEQILGAHMLGPPRARRDRRSVSDPIPCPQTVPLLNIVGGTRGTHWLKYADNNRPDVRAKPWGARWLELRIAITSEHEAPLHEATRCERITRNPVTIEFAHEQDGLVATYWARWSGPPTRGETGPWSLPVSMRIAA